MDLYKVSVYTQIREVFSNSLRLVALLLVWTQTLLMALRLELMIMIHAMINISSASRETLALTDSTQMCLWLMRCAVVVEEVQGQ